MAANWENDIFISYAHIDNVPLEEGQQGWVSNLHRALEIRVAQIRGEKPRIWRDPKLQGNDIFGDELLTRLATTALLVSVLTPRYVKSDWCTKELNEFCHTTRAKTAAAVRNKARVFKVVKTPVPLDRMPELLQKLLGYDFFAIDPETGRPYELDQIWGDEAEREFWARLNDLAYDIVGLLESLEQGEVPMAADAGAPAVYLGEATSDIAQYRESIRRDLLRHGFSVLPDRELPLVASELEEYVRAEMAKCRVSVHPLGARYGIVPEGATESVPAIENRIAREFGRGGKLARLVWIAPATQASDDRQGALLAAVRSDPGLDEGADVLETPVEGLKTVLFERLKPAEKPVALSAAAEGPATIYLICDQHDSDAVQPLRDHLFGLGYEVITPAFEGEEADLRQDHEENLRSCSAALIYYGAGGDLWLRKKMREIRAASGIGRTVPWRTVGVCVGPPVNAAKQQFRTNEAIVLPMSDGFKADELGGFVARLGGAT